MQAPLGLVKMYTLSKGATNFVAHMINGMNKVLRDFILEKNMPFLDDVPIKGCIEDENDDTMDKKGFHKFVLDHIIDCEKILSKLEEICLTLSKLEPVFGIREFVIVKHMCGS
jgi:hypothetical protein